MHKRIVVREIATNEPVFISDWASPEEFDEAWEKCLKKPFFFGDCRVYKKEVEYKREFSVHFTDIFGYGSERVFDTAGEIIFNMERDPFYTED